MGEFTQCFINRSLQEPLNLGRFLHGGDLEGAFARYGKQPHPAGRDLLHPVMFNGFKRYQLVTKCGYFEFGFIGLRLNQPGAFMMRVTRRVGIAIGAILQIAHILLHAAHQIVFALFGLGDDAIPRQLLHPAFGQVQEPRNDCYLVKNLHEGFLS